MYGKSRTVRSFICLLTIASTFYSPQIAIAQDLVASEELTAGSSAFVFRESRKKPQVQAAWGRVATGVKRRTMSSRSSAEISAMAKKRKAAMAARRKAAAATAANRKIALSNTLTAKAEGFLNDGQTDLAITNYHEALVQYPNNVRASEGLSIALTSKGIDLAGDTNNEAAIVLFEEAVKFDGQNDVAYAKLGAIYDAKGQSDRAIANYENALKINPQYSTLYTPLGLTYLDTGEVAKAESNLKKAQSAGIDSAETRYLTGLLAFKQNRDKEALAAFDRAIELDNANAMALYYRGQILARSGQGAEAVAAYKRSLAVDPAFVPAAFELGVLYYNQGDYANAATAYESAVKLDPKNYQAHANLASTYRQLERFAEANAEYKLASEGIKTPDLYSEWGYCLGKTKEWDKSVARLETAAEMSPSAIDNSNVGWAYYNAGTAQKATKNDTGAKSNLEKARIFLEKAVQQDPKLDAALLNLGSTHNAAGDFELAVKVLTQLVTMRGNWTIALNQLGAGYRGLREFKNAIDVFKKVVDSDGRNTFGLFSLGETYSASGNKSEAKKVNDKLRKIDPALAARLDNVIAGRVIDAAKQKIQQKIPIRIPGFP